MGLLVTVIFTVVVFTSMMLEIGGWFDRGGRKGGRK